MAFILSFRVFITCRRLSQILSSVRDLLRDDEPILCDHQVLTFFHGNRVCLLSFCLKVEMFFSLPYLIFNYFIHNFGVQIYIFFLI